MNILMTGGTGLIGRVLAMALLAKGHRVTVLSRSPQKYAAEMAGIELVAWNGRSWQHLLETTDAIINLAGSSIAGDGLGGILTQRWNAANKQLIGQSRVQTGRRLVEGIETAVNKPRVLIQASAIGIYGPHGDEAVAESSPAGDDFLARVCADWEGSTAQVEAMGVRRVIIRTGLVLTAQGGVLPMMLLPFRLFMGGPVGSGKQVVSWVHVQDEVNAIIYLLETESARGVYNLTAPNPVTNAQFGKVAGKVLKRPSFIPTPAFALKLALGEKAMLVLEGQRAVPNRLQEAGYNFAFSDLEVALKDLL